MAGLVRADARWAGKASTLVKCKEG